MFSVISNAKLVLWRQKFQECVHRYIIRRYSSSSFLSLIRLLAGNEKLLSLSGKGLMDKAVTSEVQDGN